MTTEATTTLIKKLKGTIVSNKMDKTVVVKVDRVKTHPKYGKKYTVSKNYHVHDPKNEGNIFDLKMIFLKHTGRLLYKPNRYQLVLGTKLCHHACIDSG